MRLLERLAIWYVKRCGYHVIAHAFRGVLLGDCKAYGSAEALIVDNKSRFVVAINGSLVDFNKKVIVE